VYQDNVAYVGSFALPSSIAGSDTRFCATNAGIIPAAFSVNEKSSIAVSYIQNFGFGPEFIGMAEMEIPETLSSSSSFAALPVAVVKRSSSDVYGGQANKLPSGATASGLTSGTDMRSNGIFHLHGSSNALVSQVGIYSLARNGYFWRRNINITSSSVEGPFSVIDPARGQVGARTNAGFMTKVPASWQSALGGDVIAGNGTISNVPAASDGPSAICFNSANITSTVAKVETGIAQGGTGGATATIQLAASANSTPDYYKNYWVYAPAAYVGSLRISAYDGATKVATIDTSIATWTTPPTSSTHYKLIPYIAGNQLIQYDVGQLDPNSADTDAFCPIWHGGTFASAMFWPNGTDSLVFVGENGGNFYQYGIKDWNTYGGLLGTDGSTRRVYNFTHPSDDGPQPLNGFSPNGDGIKFWMYSAADLAAVVSGSLTYGAIKPKAAWSFQLPSYTSYTGLGQEAPVCCYDQSTSRLYVINDVWSNNSNAKPKLGKAVHVFHINNAVNL
jgi:hypothetical protein